MSLLISTSKGKKNPRLPIVTLIIIVICFSLTLIYKLADSTQQLLWFQRWSMNPEIYMHAGGTVSRQHWWHIFSSALSAVFLHIKWTHLIGNMAFLMVFGWPAEKRLGHLIYLFLFLLSGLLVNLMLFYLQVSSNVADGLPVIGASGSISAIIGCYLTLFPSAKVGIYLPLGLYPQFARVPAILVISSWFVLQIIYTLQGSLSSQMAWELHLSGFALGVMVAILIRLFKARV